MSESSSISARASTSPPLTRPPLAGSGAQTKTRSPFVAKKIDQSSPSSSGDGEQRDSSTAVESSWRRGDEVSVYYGESEASSSDDGDDHSSSFSLVDPPARTPDVNLHTSIHHIADGYDAAAYGSLLVEYAVASLVEWWLAWHHFLVGTVRI